MSGRGGTVLDLGTNRQEGDAGGHRGHDPGELVRMSHLLLTRQPLIGRSLRVIFPRGAQ